MGGFMIKNKATLVSIISLLYLQTSMPSLAMNIDENHKVPGKIVSKLKGEFDTEKVKYGKEKKSPDFLRNSEELKAIKSAASNANTNECIVLDTQFTVASNIKRMNRIIEEQSKSIYELQPKADEADMVDPSKPKVTKLGKKVDALEADIAILKPKADEADMVDPSKPKVTKLGKKVDALEAENTGLKAEVNSLKAQNAKLQPKADEADMVNPSKPKVTKLGKKVDALEAENTGLRTEVTGLRTEVAGLRTEVAELKASNKRIEALLERALSSDKISSGKSVRKGLNVQYESEKS
jgi:predicted RNase H-like nuclease (RuvC/YqgF family)